MYVLGLPLYRALSRTSLARSLADEPAERG